MCLWEKTFICNNCMGFPASKCHGPGRWIPAVFSTGPSILKKLSTYSLKQNKAKPKPNKKQLYLKEKQTTNHSLYFVFVLGVSLKLTTT